jgi:hypothetical protein
MREKVATGILIILFSFPLHAKDVFIGVMPLVKQKIKELKEMRRPRLLVTPISLDFGRDKVEKSIIIKNEGYTPLLWHIQSYPSWCTVERVSGTLGKRESIKVKIYVHREGLRVGVYEGEILLSSNAGEQILHVSMIVEKHLLLYTFAAASGRCKGEQLMMQLTFCETFAGIVQNSKRRCEAGFLPDVQ